jgi:hypothetical protein
MNFEENYYKLKYLKYKNKYLQLQTGSGKDSAKAKFDSFLNKEYDTVYNILNNDIFLKSTFESFNLPEKYNNTDSKQIEFFNSVFDKIYELNDNKKTIDLLIKIYLKKEFGDPNSIENIGRFKGNIAKYNILKNNNIKLKELYQLESLTELEKLIAANKDNFVEIEKIKENQMQKKIQQLKIKEKGENDVEKVLDTDRVFVYIPTTKDGAIYYGSNTKWCTTSTDKKYSWFDKYNNKGKLYIIQSKLKKNDKFQIHFEKNEIKNDNNQSVDIDFVLNNFEDDKLTDYLNNLMQEYSKEYYKKYINEKDITIGSIPFYIKKLELPNLQKLTFEEKFNQPLGDSLSKLTNLESLTFKNSNYQILKDSLSNLTNLKFLTVGNVFYNNDSNQPVKEWLNNLIEKYVNIFYEKYKDQEEIIIEEMPKFHFKLELPNLKSLNFGDDFNESLGDLLSNLTNLQSLTFGDEFNQLLRNSLSKLTNLQSLTFGDNFNQSLEDSLSKLSNLKKLTFGYEFNQLLRNSLSKLTNLQSLTFETYFNQPLEDSLSKLSNLQSLTFGKLFNQPLKNSLSNLVNLQSLTFGYKFNQPLDDSLLNLINLQSLTFGYYFNQPLENSLSNLVNLQSLTFGYYFNQPLGNSLSNLTNLQSLTFGISFNQPLEDSLSKLVKLQTLKVGQTFRDLKNIKLIKE